jgi:hypothetical protein
VIEGVAISDVTAADIPWLAPAPWPNARPVVDIALAHLLMVRSDDTAAVIEHLILALADMRAERDVLRDLLAAALALAQQYDAVDRRRRRA